MYAPFVFTCGQEALCCRKIPKYGADHSSHLCFLRLPRFRSLGPSSGRFPGWNSDQPDESRTGCPSRKLSRPQPGPAVVVSRNNLRTEVGEPDHQQPVSAGTPDPPTNLRKLHAELFSQPPEWKSEVNTVEMKRAHIRVFHDPKHLSQVVLPIIPMVR